MDARTSQARRATISDVAATAGVSVATVDRVLNKRHPVRPETAERVLAAAERLGFRATALLRERLRPQAARRLGFLLQRPSSQFYQGLAAELERATLAQAGGERARFAYAQELEPALIVERMQELGQRVDAMAVVAVDHPRVHEEVARQRGRGVPVFTLLSDLSTPARAGYVGLDARQAGRTAAWAITRMAKRPGPVGIVVGSHRYLDHDTREIAMRSYLRENAAGFVMLEPLVDNEQPAVAYDAALALLRRHPGVIGLYCTGSGTDGILRALAETGAAGRVVVVVNELTPANRSALIDGLVDLVIAVPLARLAETAVRGMLAAAADPAHAPLVQSMLPLELYGPENV